MIGHVVQREPTFNSMWVEGQISLSSEEPLTPDSPSGTWHLSEEGDGYMYSYIGMSQTHTYE